MIKELKDYDETFNLGIEIGKNASPGDIYCLVGDLGTGKTVLSSGIAKGLGICEDITSPTFTIVNSYEDIKTYSKGLPLYHFDVYRILDSSEMNDLGFEDMIYSQGVSIIEWADMIKDLIPKEAVWIRLERDLSINEDFRRITIEGLKYEL